MRGAFGDSADKAAAGNCYQEVQSDSLSLTIPNEGITRMTLCLDRPRLYVDFNEMTARNVVLLSQTDKQVDSVGNIIELSEGLAVYIYMDDPDIDGRIDFLVAKGTCRQNTQLGWSSEAKWTCEIDGAGISHLSELQ